MKITTYTASLAVAGLFCGSLHAAYPLQRNWPVQPTTTWADIVPDPRLVRSAAGQVEWAESRTIQTAAGTPLWVLRLEFDDGRMLWTGITNPDRTLLSIDPGDTVRVIGRPARVQGRPVLLADRVQVAGEADWVRGANSGSRLAAEPAQNPRSRSAGISGIVEDFRMVTIPRDEHAVSSLRIQFEDGRVVYTRNMGRLWARANLSPNDELRLEGRAKSLGGTRVLWVENAWLNGIRTRFLP